MVKMLYHVHLVLYRYVEGSDLFCCGKFMYNHYQDCKDTNFFLCGDEVSDIVCLPANMVPDLTPVLACQDRVLRVLQVCYNLVITWHLVKVGLNSVTLSVYLPTWSQI